MGLWGNGQQAGIGRSAIVQHRARAQLQMPKVACFSAFKNPSSPEVEVVGPLVLLVLDDASGEGVPDALGVDIHSDYNRGRELCKARAGHQGIRACCRGRK